MTLSAIAPYKRPGSTQPQLTLWQACSVALKFAPPAHSPKSTTISNSDPCAMCTLWPRAVTAPSLALPWRARSFLYYERRPACPSARCPWLLIASWRWCAGTGMMAVTGLTSRLPAALHSVLCQHLLVIILWSTPSLGL